MRKAFQTEKVLKREDGSREDTGSSQFLQERNIPSECINVALGYRFSLISKTIDFHFSDISISGLLTPNGVPIYYDFKPSSL